MQSRKVISIYEFVGVITKLAQYLYTLPSITKYVEDPSIESIVNPCELALELLLSGKYDAKIIRTFDEVNFSELSINPIWIDTARNYFKQQNSFIENNLLSKLELR
jgi:hypothetical protein